MSTISKTQAFSAKERECEIRFISSGPFWHMFTNGNLSQTLFCDTDDFIFGMNLTGYCASHFPDVHIYTFEVMNNHLHFILQAEKTRAILFFGMLRNRLQRYYIKRSRCVDLSEFQCEFVPIENLNTLRNEIAYVNRNGFVVRPDCTPFSYPWGAGALFFNPFLKHEDAVAFKKLPVKVKRRLIHSHDIDANGIDLTVYKGVILPSSYCHIKEAEGMFRDAHHYFHLISKAFEAFSEIARRLHESIFLSDEEMYAAVSSLTLKRFNTKQPILLTAKDKIEVARIMHYDFNASNRQIKNILKLDAGTVDELFPK